MWLSSLPLDWLLGQLGIRIGVLLGRTVLGPMTWFATVETVSLVGVGTPTGQCLLLEEGICLSCNPWISGGGHVSKV